MYYTISAANADKLIQNEVNRQIAKYIAEHTPKQVSEESRTSEYSLTDFAVNANLSTRSYNCLCRAGIETLEELVEYTPKELIKSVRNLGRRSLEEIEKALKEIGLSLKEELEVVEPCYTLKLPHYIDKQTNPAKSIESVSKPTDEPSEKKTPQAMPTSRKPLSQYEKDCMKLEKVEFCQELDGAFHISITSNMIEEFKKFDPITEYGGKEDNRDIQRAWHEHVLMQNVYRIIDNMLKYKANEEELVRVIKYAFVASRCIDYAFDYERAETDFGIGGLYRKYVVKAN